MLAFLGLHLPEVRQKVETAIDEWTAMLILWVEMVTSGEIWVDAPDRNI